MYPISLTREPQSGDWYRIKRPMRNPAGKVYPVGYMLRVVEPTTESPHGYNDPYGMHYWLEEEDGTKSVWTSLRTLISNDAAELVLPT